MGIAATRLQNFRVNTEGMYKNEFRASQYGAFDFFETQTGIAGGIASPELIDKAIGSIGTPLEYPTYVNEGLIAITNTRTLTLPDNDNSTAIVGVNFATYSFGFSLTPMQYHNNEFSLQADYDVKMKRALLALATQVDTDAIAALATFKTQVLPERLGYTFTANTLHAAYDQRETLLGDLEVLQNANDFYGQTHIIAGSGIKSITNKLAQHGLYNDQNKQLEYNGLMFHYSNRMTNETTDFGTGYAVQDGNVALLKRFERDALYGTVMKTGHTWGIETLPILNIPCGTYSYEMPVDASGLAGSSTADMTRTGRQYFGFSVDMAFLTAYNSTPTTRANPCLKFVVTKPA